MSVTQQVGLGGFLFHMDFIFLISFASRFAVILREATPDFHHPQWYFIMEKAGSNTWISFLVFLMGFLDSFYGYLWCNEQKMECDHFACNVCVLPFLRQQQFPLSAVFLRALSTSCSMCQIL